MNELYKQIQGKSFTEIKQDEKLLLVFLRLYSYIYLQGKRPEWCEKCQEKYYRQLRTDEKNGKINELMNEAEKIKNRKIKPNWHGLIYLPKTGQHWNNETMTDEKALYLIDNGFLSADYFVFPHIEEKPKKTNKKK